MVALRRTRFSNNPCMPLATSERKIRESNVSRLVMVARSNPTSGPLSSNANGTRGAGATVERERAARSELGWGGGVGGTGRGVVTTSESRSVA